ncbi:ATPase component [Pseudomonas syringae pv. actinidiae]|uniref:ATPase component n=1 Tax=Pseudomonas syringae pv. actinidiae TaxID=103796 RepID=A0A2V0QE49_PSESF|nr:ATPase component [Pseudomonas syringae pv. actinidiae]
MICSINRLINKIRRLDLFPPIVQKKAILWLQVFRPYVQCENIAGVGSRIPVIQQVLLHWPHGSKTATLGILQKDIEFVLPFGHD